MMISHGGRGRLLRRRDDVPQPGGRVGDPGRDAAPSRNRRRASARCGGRRRRGAACSASACSPPIRCGCCQEAEQRVLETLARRLTHVVGTARARARARATSGRSRPAGDPQPAERAGTGPGDGAGQRPRGAAAVAAAAAGRRRGPAHRPARPAGQRGAQPDARGHASASRSRRRRVPSSSGQVQLLAGALGRWPKRRAPGRRRGAGGRGGGSRRRWNTRTRGHRSRSGRGRDPARDRARPDRRRQAAEPSDVLAPLTECRQ